MTARIPIDQERDFYRAQSNFVRDLAEFAVVNGVHVVLVGSSAQGYGRRLEYGSIGSETYILPTLAVISWMDEIQKKGLQHNAEIEVSKGRKHGDTGTIAFNFDKASKRFVLTSGKQIERYGWEDEGLKNKYNAIKTTVDGITFDSKAEAQRYNELKLLKQGGAIQWFNRQPSFMLRPCFIVCGDDGTIWVEDVKGQFKGLKKQKEWAIQQLS